MGLSTIEFSFDKIDKPIVQIYGPNRCGKTVLIQELHPFSNVSLNGDERNDLSLILPNQVGLKNIVYDVDGEIYNITHTYKPTPSGNHSVSSSIVYNGEELNPSGRVTVFNNLIEKLFGINKYIFQFIINGTNLTSFANMSFTQRKDLLNKAKGIDVYDKIHKLAKDDYRYTNKLITSLNNTKEYLMSTHGSYETLCGTLNTKRNESETLTRRISELKSKLDSLQGTINVIRQQNVSQELYDLTNMINSYDSIVQDIGCFDGNVYDSLVDEQIKLNNELSELKNKRLLIMKDIDVLYDKKNNIESIAYNNQKALSDYNEMVSQRDRLKTQVDNITIECHVESSSSFLCMMMSLAQTINSICKEIISSLNGKHLKLFSQMVQSNIDISAFLIQESTALMDSEKEKSVISHIRHLINSIDGEYVDDCCYSNCIYKKTHDTLDIYFKSFQSDSASKFTQYDIEQMDHAYKNVLSIKRLLQTEIPPELKDVFDIKTIMKNLVQNQIGIDVKFIQYLIEESGKIELRNKYISQLSEVEKTISNMKNIIPTDNTDEALQNISGEIESLNQVVKELDIEIDKYNSALTDNDNRKMKMSQIKNVDIKDLRKRHNKLQKLSNTLINSENEFNQLNSEMSQLTNQLYSINNELVSLENVYNQYTNNLKEIEKYQSSDERYKIIAEATSSTKGKPVLVIRETVETALLMANRLLDVMYDGEIEMLDPIINESTFSLPFRCGLNTSPDIKYGSQSESTLLSLALSLSLASMLTNYNVILCDEVDSFIDQHMSDGFVLMLQEIMSTLKMEQMFIISHKIVPEQYTHIIHPLNIFKQSEEE